MDIVPGRFFVRSKRMVCKVVRIQPLLVVVRSVLSFLILAVGTSGVSAQDSEIARIYVPIDSAWKSDSEWTLRLGRISPEYVEDARLGLLVFADDGSAEEIEVRRSGTVRGSSLQVRPLGRLGTEPADGSLLVIDHTLDTAGWDDVRRSAIDGVWFFEEGNRLLEPGHVLQGGIPTDFRNEALELVRSSARSILEFGNPDPVLTDPVGVGRFAESSILATMSGATLEMLDEFFAYVASEPSMFRLRSPVLSTAFAIWISMGAPVEVVGLRRRLIAADGREFLSIVERNRAVLSDGYVLDEWATDAELLGGDGRIDAARDLIGVVVKAAALLELPDVEGWGHFVGARIEDFAGNTDSTRTMYERAIASFGRGSDSVGLTYALNNLGALERRLGDPAAAIKTLTRAIELKETLLATDADPSNVRSLAFTVVVRAMARRDAGDPAGAIADFSEGARLYRVLGTTDLADYVDALRQIGVTYNQQSETARAREVLDSARVAVAGREGFAEAHADVLDELAYSHALEHSQQRALELYREAHQLHLESGDLDDAGFSLSNVGQTYWILGDIFEAEKAHRGAILLRQETGNRVGEAYSWTKLGYIYTENGRPTEASDAFDRAAELLGQIGDTAGLASIAEARGDLLSRYGTSSSALSAYKEAVTLQLDAGDYSAASSTMTEIGNLHLNDGDYGLAESAYREVLIIAERSSPRDSIFGLTGLGLVLRSRGDPDSAFALFTLADRISRESGGLSERAWTTRQLATIDADLGRRTDARRRMTDALELYRELEDIDGQISLHLALGYLSYGAGRFDESMARYLEAEDLARVTGRNGRIPEILSSIADLRSTTGDFAGALEADSASLRMSLEAGNDWSTAVAQVGVGNTLNAMGEYSGAVDAYRRADSIYRFLGDDLSRATPLNNIGTIWFFQGDYPRALTAFEQALELVGASGQENDFFGLIHSNIGEVHYEAGRFDQAIEWLEKGAEIADRVGARRNLASAYTLLARATLDVGDIDRAGRYAQVARDMAEEIGEPEQLARVRTVIGRILLERNDPERAALSLADAIEAARTIGARKWMWRPLYLLGTIERDRGNREAAIENLKESIAIIEYLRERVSGGEEAVRVYESDNARSMVYELLVGLLIEEGDVETALGYLEQNSNSALRSRFGSALANSADTTYRDLIDQERILKARLDRLSGEIAAERGRTGASDEKIEELERIVSIAEADYIGFVNETVRNEPELRVHFSSGVNPIELRSRKQRIPPEVGILSYLLGEESAFIFVATRDTVIARVVPVPKSDVARSVSGLLRLSSLAPGDPDRFDGEARMLEYSTRLYDWLVDPVRDEVADKEYLAIIPSGPLQVLPFGILGSDRLGELGAAHSVFYISDLGLFLDDPPASPLSSITAFANPDATLPFAEEEADVIARIYPTSRVFAGDEATETRAKRVEQVGTLHFATHGRLDYSDYEQSWLMLAPDPDEGEDGRLTLSEIWGIPNLADCRLVTLSACNSAIGEEIVEGWPVNPANAFLQIGVPTVVATLWQVDDRATSMLMQQFYSGLGTMGAAESLAAAQRRLAQSDDYADPYYWAPFVLLGDWR